MKTSSLRKFLKFMLPGLASLLGWGMAYAIRFGLSPSGGTEIVYPGLIWISVIFQLFYAFLLGNGPEIGRVCLKPLIASVLSLMTLCTILFFGPDLALSHEVVLSAALLTLLLEGFFEFVMRRVFARRDRGFVRRTVIVGAGQAGTALARELNVHPEYGLKVSGFLDDYYPKAVRDGYPILGETASLPDLLADHRFDQVIVALPGSVLVKTQSIVENCLEQDVPVAVLNETAGVLHARETRSRVLAGIPVIEVLADEPWTASKRFVENRLADDAVRMKDSKDTGEAHKTAKQLVMGE